MTTGGMTPEQIKAAQEKLGQLEEGQEPEQFKGWETGYRGWKLRFKEGQPRLGAVAHEAIWEPIDIEDVDPVTGEKIISKEVRSDWTPEDEPFERTSKGLYSLRDVKEVKQRYGQEDIYGAITPYGKTFHGQMGYRSEKAKVKALFKGSSPCHICRKPAKYHVHNDERFSLCESCLKRLERLVVKKGYTQEDVDDVLRRLAEVYGAELVDE